MREATPAEIAALMGDESPASAPRSGMREATPAEIQALMGDDKPGIKPGDVAARKAQVEAAAASEQPNQVRERLGIISEAAGGAMDVVRNARNLFNKDAYEGVVSNPIVGAGLGALRTASSPMAPAANVAARLGEDVSSGLQKAGFTGLADVAGAASMAAADVLAPLAASKVAKGAVAFAKDNPAMGDRVLKSSRMRAKEAEQELVQSNKAAEAKVAAIKSETEQGKRFVDEIADEQRAAIPTAQELKAKFAPNAMLGKDVGKQWQEGYFNQLKTTKDRFNKQYGDTLREGSAIEHVPESYLAAAKDLREAKGMSGRPSIGPAEGVAERLKSFDNLEDFMDDTTKALREQLRGGNSAEKAYAEEALKEFMGKGAKEMPETPTVRDLIFERQRLKAGQRAVSSDAGKQQFSPLIKALEDDIVRADETIAQKLFATDTAYKNEFVPYFSKGTLTRAISEKDPAAVVDMIFQPSLSGGRVGKTNRAEEAITRAQELMSPQLWTRVKGAFTNKLIENSMEGGVLNQKKLVKEWGKYLDPAGSNNAVLRKGLGERDFQSLNSVVNQMQRTTPESISSYAKQLTKGLEKQGKTSIETVQAAQKLTEKRLVEKIARETGSSTEMVTNRLQSIGSGVFVSGLMRGSGSVMLEGAGLVMGSQALATVLGSVRGRNVFKAMLRSAPGTSQKAAQARILQQLISQQGEEE